MRFTSKVYAFCVVLALVVLAFPVFAQEAASQQGVSIPEVTITISEEGFDVPASIPAGIVHVVYDNQLETPAFPELVMLNEGETSDAVLEAFGMDPMSAMALVTMMGGTELAPQTTTTITYDFDAGNYLLMNFGEESPEPDVYEFTAEETDINLSELPQPDVTVNLADFVFGIPTTLDAGETLWQIDNLGNQWHEMFIAPVDEGTTLEQATDLVMQAVMAENPEDAPIVPTFMWSPMGAGTRAWVNINLEPGTYVVVCALPDLTSEEMTSHLEHGMIQLINVQ